MRKKNISLPIASIALSIGSLSAPLLANVVGADTQNFNPVTDGLDYVTVQSSKTLAPCVFNVGLFGNYATNSLPYFDTDSASGPGVVKQEKLKDSLVGLDINVGYGITRAWDIGLSAPQVLSQTVNSDELHGQFAQQGLTELRLNTKLRLFGGERGGFAVVGTLNQNLIQNNPYAGKNGGPTITGELVGDRTFGPVSAAINIGYRKRSPGDAIANAPVVPMDDQVIASVAGSFLVESISTKLILEAFASQPIKDKSNISDRELSSAEALAGLKFDATDSLAIHLGAGSELTHGVSSPDARLYAGLNYVIGPVCHTKKTSRKITPKKRPAARPLPPPAVVAEEPAAIPEPAVPEPELEIRTTDEHGENPFSGAPPTEGIETIVIHNINFAFDRDDLVLPGSLNILQQLYDYLMKEPKYTRLVIEGHTDYMGSHEYNQDLSERRAGQIRAYLVRTFNLDPKSVESVGFGKKVPVANNGNYQGRQLNRRVEFRIYRD